MTTLYRLYRPKTFAELESQEHIVRTLQGALKSGRVGHAYLFCGPRGTGKTTTARIFAKVLNCEKRKGAEPCNECFSCTQINEGRSLDLIEIDAASNRGIDEIRNVKEAAGTAATSSHYKIFIIDEVHMLTKDAFNALLKTLEEPASHIVFILATTEPHKVPETILSRVQRFDFRKLEKNQIISKLKKIGKTEKLAIDDESLDLIATAAGGSLRDAESALGKVMAYVDGKITATETSKILGVIPERTHAEFFQYMLEKKSAEALAQISTLYESGTNMEQFCAQFIAFARKKLLERHDERIIQIIKAFMAAKLELKSSPIPQLPLELAVIQLTT